MDDVWSIHPKIESDLHRLYCVVATVGIPRVVRLANTGDEVINPAPIGYGSSEGKEKQVSAGDKGVRKPVYLHRDFRVAGE
jgi:hypothetical protein